MFWNKEKRKAEEAARKNAMDNHESILFLAGGIDGVAKAPLTAKNLLSLQSLCTRHFRKGSDFQRDYCVCSMFFSLILENRYGDDFRNFWSKEVPYWLPVGLLYEGRLDAILQGTDRSVLDWPIHFDIRKNNWRVLLQTSLNYEVENLPARAELCETLVKKFFQEGLDHHDDMIFFLHLELFLDRELAVRPL